MSAISRFSASILEASQETTVALASLNFDFSLYKVEAPAEYQALGSCLSKERRRRAEDGSQHMTARRLGAVFRSKIPRVPHLIRAYGQRVSEIATSASAATGSQSIGSKLVDSPFRDHLGIDGTAIWAAATSGSEAVCVQLLACLLARFWSPKEATSIWAEILEARKQELRQSLDDFGFAELAALQANVMRDQLAEWDASARSWLLTADRARNKQQTQLRLIISNISIMVNAVGHTYQSVMDAWIESMKVVDNLVQGIPQSIHHGAALVGLAAWHLYPNMSIYEGTIKEVTQHDPLIRTGGILTVGLQSRTATGNGVRWSLPLAKLRYYGEPVVVTKALNEPRSRLSVRQVFLIVIGMLAREWPDMERKYETICKYWLTIWRKESGWRASAKRLTRMKRIRNRASGVERIVLHDGDPPQAEPSWVPSIGMAAESFLNASGDGLRACTQLIDLGYRRGGAMVGGGMPGDEQKYRLPTFREQLFSLDLPATFIQRLFRRVNGKHVNNHRVQYLRNAVTRHMGHERPEDWILLYPGHITTVLPRSGPRSVSPEHRYHCHWKTTTDITMSSRTSSRFGDSTKNPEPTDRTLDEWFFDMDMNEVEIPEEVLILLSEASEEAPDQEYAHESNAASYLRLQEEKSAATQEISAEVISIKYLPSLGSEFTQRYCRRTHDGIICEHDTVQFSLVYGTGAAASVYRRVRPTSEARDPEERHDLPALIPLEDILTAIEEDKILFSPAFSNVNDVDHWGILKGLGSMAQIYRSLEGATISMDFLSSPLISMQWFRSLSFLRSPWWFSPELSHAGAFSCISMMETGQHDLDPAQLESVMAISVGDSIYAVPPLISDPFQMTERTTISRAIGNLGSAGVTMLIPPPSPISRKPQPGEWYVINHDTWAGDMANSFDQTSLHLLLTEYRLPYAPEKDGARDVQAFFQEAVVSIYDGNSWVGDVDILKALTGVTRVPSKCPHRTASPNSLDQRDCAGEPTGDKGRAAKMNDDVRLDGSSSSKEPPGEKIATLDNWFELLDKPRDPAVVRSHGNWVGRLATAALSAQLGGRTIILPEDDCEKCGVSKVRLLRNLKLQHGDIIIM